MGFCEGGSTTARQDTAEPNQRNSNKRTKTQVGGFDLPSADEERVLQPECPEGSKSKKGRNYAVPPPPTLMLRGVRY
eukprot:3233827-Rhodomonas_salina.3